MIGSMAVGGQVLTWGLRTYVMGIINLTRDSFSGDGLAPASETPPADKDLAAAALAQARRFVQEGADLLDVGAESTRPGAQSVSAAEELDRLLPAISMINRELPAVPLSVDTYKAEVAEAAVQAGAHIINDVWGLRADPELAATAARNRVPVILMHNRSRITDARIQENLGGRYVGVEYRDLFEDIRQELLDSVRIALDAGIPEKNIILDPGIGFGKTVEQNLEIVNHLDRFQDLGFPLMIGPSRKSFIGYTLDLPVDQRLEGTAAAVAVAVARGVDIVRVHDVHQMVRVTRMADAIVRGKADRSR